MHLPEPEDRLSSWKEIAAYLGRDIRTVQRWEKNHGLPLRRGGPGQRRAVIASKQELSGWWERRRSSLQHEEPPRARYGWRASLAVLLVAIVVAVATAGTLLRRTDTTQNQLPATFGRLLAVSTSEGRGFVGTPVHAEISGLALAPSGDVAYVALAADDAVAIVDLRARRVVDRIAVMETPTALALDAQGSRLLVGGTGELGVLDLRRRTFARFKTDGTPNDLHLAPDGRFIWIALARGGLKVFDLETGKLEVIPTVGCPMRLAAAPRSQRVFVSYQCGGPGGRDGHDAIEIFDGLTRKPILARASVPLVGGDLAVSPDEQHLWAETRDACENEEYDRVGCPSGQGPVLHALRANTLEPLLTFRANASGAGFSPVFFPDGTRVVLAGGSVAVVDRALGTVREAAQLITGTGQFSADGRRFVTVDVVNRGLIELQISPPDTAEHFDGIASHWSGDGTANDIAGGAHARTTDGLRFEAGRYGQAFSLDGRSAGANFGRRLDAVITDGPATYAAWIKPKSVGSTMHLLSRTSSNGWSWSLTADGRAAFCFQQGPPALSCANGGLVSATKLTPGTWYHIAIVRNASALTIFVDGREDATTSLALDFRPLPPGWNEPVMRLGAGPDGAAGFHGLIDEVTLFRRELSSDELLRLRRATWLDAK